MPPHKARAGTSALRTRARASLAAPGLLLPVWGRCGADSVTWGHRAATARHQDYRGPSSPGHADRQELRTDWKNRNLRWVRGNGRWSNEPQEPVILGGAPTRSSRR